MKILFCQLWWDLLPWFSMVYSNGIEIAEYTAGWDFLLYLGVLSLWLGETPI